MCQPVRRPGGDRQKAARELVFALRAALEGDDPVGDAELDGLVVTGLEMQAQRYSPRDTGLGIQV